VYARVRRQRTCEEVVGDAATEAADLGGATQNGARLGRYIRRCNGRFVVELVVLEFKARQPVIIDVVAEAEAEARLVVGPDRGAVPEADVLGEDDADLAIPLPVSGAPAAGVGEVLRGCSAAVDGPEGGKDQQGQNVTSRTRHDRLPGQVLVRRC